MTPLAAQYQQTDVPGYSMKNAVTKSLLFHALIVGVTMIGLPFVAKDTPITSTPINVEIVDVAEIAQTTHLAPPVKEDEPKAAPKEQERPDTPRQMTAEAPPDLTVPTPPDVEIEEIPKEILEPKPEEKPKPAEKPAPKPKAKPKPVAAKAPEKKQEDRFDSLLKNLAPDTPKSDSPVQEDNADKAAGELSQLAALGDKMTISELDAFKQQLAPCWNVQSGSKFAEDIVVEVRVFMNPDKTLQSASIIDQVRYTLDSHFRAAADSALRALRNPSCQPFKLPEGKYQQWKVMTIRFDPQDML